MVTTASTVIVTGAANGIGCALALGFHREGFVVLGVDHDARNLTAVEAAGALTEVADVADPRQVTAVVGNATARLGRIDVLVNGAGVILDRRVPDHAEGEFERVVQINLFGAFHFLRAVIPVMQRQGYGRVINITSRALASPRRSAYGASKAGLLALTRCVAKEVLGQGILVNALLPGDTRTAINPTAAQEPEVVYPYARALATLPDAGPTGKVFRYGCEFRLFEEDSDRGSFDHVARRVASRVRSRMRLAPAELAPDALLRTQAPG